MVVVKELKKNVSPETLGVEVKVINSTLNGHVRIRVTEKTPGAKQHMIQKIRETVTSAETTTVTQKTKGVVIMDIDCDVEERELLLALSSILDTPKEDIKANPFKNMKMCNQMVTVFLPIEAAEKVIQMGKIKIGWTHCRVKERYDPPFCQKCQVFGHLTYTCASTTLTTRKCLNCGGEHKTSQCSSKKEFCITCKTEGHRANAMKCPVYRKLINDRKTHE